MVAMMDVIKRKSSSRKRRRANVMLNVVRCKTFCVKRCAPLEEFEKNKVCEFKAPGSNHVEDFLTARSVCGERFSAICGCYNLIEFDGTISVMIE